MNKRNTPKRRTAFWTRDRVILGLQRFYKDFGFCALSSEQYAKHAQHSGRDELGRRSNLGWHQRYPSFATVLKFWPTFRQAWTAAGFEVDRWDEEWLPIEDWFILESVGILHRDEVAATLKRSPAAVKRRIYDIGICKSYNRWGITLTHAAKLMGLSDAVIRKYLELGIIPYFRGIKLIYLNPADLLKIEEYNWAGTIDPELDQLVRRSVAQRICKMIKFGSAWRDHEVYKIHKIRDRYQGRMRNARTSVLTKHLPDPPNDIDVGDWVKTTGKVRSMQTEVGNRIGRVKNVYYSWQRVGRIDGTRRASWVAMVEFPKIRTITGEKDRRIRYSIPLDYLEKTDEPLPEPKPLSSHPDAVKGRQRNKAGEYDRRKKRIRERVADMAGELT